MDDHVYEIDSDDGRTVVFVCPVDHCRRRIILDRRSNRYTVIDRGDFFAAHLGAVGPIGLRLQ